jgi:hypothetical protein
MNKAFLFNLIIILFCSVNCVRNNTKQINNKNQSFDTISNIYDIDFNVKLNGGDDLIFFDSAFYQFFDFCGDSTLKIVNLKNNELIVLNYHDPSCGQVYASIKSDGIYLVSEDNKIYKYRNGEKKAEKLFDLMELDVFKNSGLTAYWYKGWGTQHVNIPDSILYFRIEKDLDNERGKYSLLDSMYPIFAKVNHKTNEINFFGYSPNIGPGLMHRSFQIYMENSIFVSYAYNDKIELINTLNNQTKVFSVKSSFDTVPIKTFEYNEATYTLQKNTKHALETANYGPLYFNPYNNNFYRIFHPYLPERDGNGELNTDIDKSCVLMIMDSNFKLKEEVILPVKWAKLMTLFPNNNAVDFYMAPNHLIPKGDKTEFNYLRYRHL